MATPESLIRSDKLIAARLVELDFPDGIFRAWSGGGELETLDGKMWKGVGSLGRISIIKDTDDLAANEVIVGLRRVADGNELDQAAFSAAVNLERNQNVYNRDARIYLQVMDPETITLVGTPLPEFIGIMSHIVTRREGTNFVEINVSLENLFAEGRKPPHLHFSDADQQARFPGDKGFEFIAANTEKVLIWPRN